MTTKSNDILRLCNECAAKMRLAFPKKELLAVDGGINRERCDHCRKTRHCIKYELRNKTPQESPAGPQQ